MVVAVRTSSGFSDGRACGLPSNAKPILENINVHITNIDMTFLNGFIFTSPFSSLPFYL